jgi:hypothetical protein
MMSLWLVGYLLGMLDESLVGYLLGRPDESLVDYPPIMADESLGVVTYLEYQMRPWLVSFLE